MHHPLREFYANMCLLCVTFYDTKYRIVTRPKCCLDFGDFSAADNAEMWSQWLERDLTIDEVELIERKSIRFSYIAKPVKEDLLKFVNFESTYLYFCILTKRESDCFIVIQDYPVKFLNDKTNFSGASLLTLAIRHHVSEFAKSLIDLNVDCSDAIEACLCAGNLIVLKYLLYKGYQPGDISWFAKFKEQPNYAELLACF